MSEPFEAEVIVPELPNMGVHRGAPFMLLRGKGGDVDGCFALAQQVGDQVSLCSDWVGEQKTIDGALRVICGDPVALTSPKALLHIAIALVGCFAFAERRKRGAEEKKTEPQT